MTMANPPTDPDPADLLRLALHDPGIARSQEAARDLVALGPPSAAIVSTLAEALKGEGTTARRRAANLLGQFGGSAPGAAPALAGALDDPSWTVREAAARALAPWSAEDEARRALVRAALRDRNRLVRDSAARSLAREDRALEGLNAGLADDRAAVRCRALRALALAADRAEAIVPDLARSLRDSHRKVRRAAATALGPLGRAAAPALPELIRRLHDGEPAVREAAGAAIAAIAPALDGRWRAWLDVLTDPGLGPEEALRLALDRADLPAPARKGFAALCLRRARWHARRVGASPVPENPPPPSAREAAGLALAGAAGPGRADEAAWLLARLAELLPRGWGPEPMRPGGMAP